ncbi:MAG: hypothetical protein Q8R36_02265 [bacterium]|nr:hypothetical protein [bacterium]
MKKRVGTIEAEKELADYFCMPIGNKRSVAVWSNSTRVLLEFTRPIVKTDTKKRLCIPSAESHMCGKKRIRTRVLISRESAAALHTLLGEALNNKPGGIYK